MADIEKRTGMTDAECEYLDNLMHAFRFDGGIKQCIF